MFNTNQAFTKFKSRLEITVTEQNDAIKRHNEVRDVIRAKFTLDDDFLTGSYRRHTKTKPLQDVDIFCVLNAAEEGHYLKKSSSVLIEAFRASLADHYGEENVTSDTRCVIVRFGKPAGSEAEEEKVFSIDVAPAFADGSDYKIPDSGTAADWLKTNPKVHAEKATEANKNFNEEWKPLIKMIKRWNRFNSSPVSSSFLLEVMALDILFPPFSGGYARELKSFFATAATRIYDIWPDPAGVGPDACAGISQSERQAISTKMKETGKAIDRAIQLEKSESYNAANRIWRDEVFGPMFPLS